MASGSQPSTSASSELRRASDQHTVAPEPSTSKLRRRMSAPVLTQPPSASSDSGTSFELPSKRKGKASKKAVNPRKRGRGGSSSSRTTEEELGWHNKEEKDQTPEPLRFMPARVPGPALDTTAPWGRGRQTGGQSQGEERRGDQEEQARRKEVDGRDSVACSQLEELSGGQRVEQCGSH
ncbi:hypothetical protein F7725_013552 [Dissostichus mawsoni]|uniref:Uncharacterized protein n=1 Tax=Dissostichus mawsoni TaxID=36200 RepID=A0A7J5Y5A3_DISMA|nr:hypothetical protein F7725_013552 [Dissostichus mawsoni]